jgi:AcrR family transcriptional regulator
MSLTVQHSIATALSADWVDPVSTPIFAVDSEVSSHYLVHVTATRIPHPASNAARPRSIATGTPGHRLHADERRVEVISAAVVAFASGGYAGTSTETIARLAGVSQPYLFRLFGSKQQLFIAAVGRSFEQIALAFEEGARHPKANAADFHPVLAGIGNAYGELMFDRSLLRLQLHAFAACDDPVIRSFVRAEFARLVGRVSDLSGVPQADLRSFFAEGMLMNVESAMDLTEADVAWAQVCDGGPA